MNLVSKIELILEWGSLKKIDLPSGLSGIKKEAEGSVRSYRNEALKIVIDSYRKRYPLLEKVIQGETTFEKEYKPLINKYTGIKNFLFPTGLTKKETRIPRENKELIHDYGLPYQPNAMPKPFSWAALGAALGLVFNYVASSLGTTPLPYLTMGAVSGIGFLVGIGNSESNIKLRNALKKDLKLLDEQIREVYQKS